MAIIAISRQVAAFGDEIAEAAARELNYTFITRKQIEARIVEMGFPKEKLSKYDERKPKFFASLAKGRDEYLNYLQLAIKEAASKGNCILIGRGAFVILKSLPNLVPLRFVAEKSIRKQRLMKEFNWNEKQALARIEESAMNRKGFHKSFFDVDHEDPANYLVVMNTGLLSQSEAVKHIVGIVQNMITPEKEEAGKIAVQRMLKCQELVNTLLFEYKININFLHADYDSSGKFVILQGMADSQAIVDRAITLGSKILPDVTIKSSINVVQDFKSY